MCPAAARRTATEVDVYSRGLGATEAFGSVSRDGSFLSIAGSRDDGSNAGVRGELAFVSGSELCLSGICARVCAGPGSARSGAGFAVSPVFGDLEPGVVDGDDPVGGATIAGAATNVRGGSKTSQVNQSITALPVWILVL